MIFPLVEEYLPQLHSKQKKLLDNTYEWMIKNNTLKAATNIENLDPSLATFIGNSISTIPIYQNQSDIFSIALYFLFFLLYPFISRTRSSSDRKLL